MSPNPYKWARPGDVNAFFGLMLDNVANMVLMVGLLAAVFGFPVDFALKYMIPGTAIGVFVGDMLYFWLARRMAKREGRDDVTAMPLGLDTPSTFGMIFLVLGPAFSLKLAELAEATGMSIEEMAAAAQSQPGLAETFQQMNVEAATFAWHIGICSIFVSGLLKFALAFGSNWIRRVVPRAGLLGSLAAIALVLITFAPLEEIFKSPLVGFATMVIIFVTLVARQKLPFKLPGAFAAVVLGCLVWYLLQGLDAAGLKILGESGGEGGSEIHWFPVEWLTVFRFEWVGAMGEAVTYFPYIFPFAIATVIGGIDCAESAAAAGDDYDTGTIIGIEAFATLVASLCGGVIQSTPYIGHPAYKAMGGRAAYVLGTALFVGGAGLIGYFGLLFMIIPKAAIMPILLFIGIEITAQSFHATPKRHYAALAIACLPAMAKLVALYVGQYATQERIATDPGILNLNVMAGGFIITSLIWASALANIIDRRFSAASIYFACGGILVLFGVMHSPLNDQMFWPWQLNQLDDKGVALFSDPQKKIVIEFAIAYLMMAVILFGLEKLLGDKLVPINSDEEYEALDNHSVDKKTIKE